MAELQEVFKIGGVPGITFVKPIEYTTVILNLRTPGRGLVVEGPSGIGKTTAVLKAIDELGLSHKVVRLSARKPSDLEYISLIPEMSNFGVVLVDDFHKLETGLKRQIADMVKVFADEEAVASKLIVLGINEAGQSLISFAPDLVNRIDIIKFENNPDAKVEELIGKGEDELNITIGVKSDIVKEANGGFYIAQMLCSEICRREEILQTVSAHRDIDTSIEIVKYSIWNRLSSTFYPACKAFALGARFRPEGRAPYLHLLIWLATSGEWLLNISDALRNHAEMRLSVGQVVEKGYLQEVFNKNPNLAAVLHFDGKNIVIEDPQFVFYIRNMPWARFARDVGFKNVEFKSKYDFALSFAGSDRDVASAIFEKLSEEELAVFYDKNEQHRIIAENVEDYLEPIFQSEASFIICLISSTYPQRIWTAFEARAFEARIGLKAVIPIVIDKTPIDAFSAISKIGHLSFDRMGNNEEQISEICSTLSKKLSDTD